MSASSRIRAMARALIAAHGARAQAVAFATVAVLVENGQADYAQLWWQIARTISSLLAGDGGSA